MHSLLRPASTASAAAPPSGKRKSAARQRAAKPAPLPSSAQSSTLLESRPCLQGGLNALFKGFVAPDAAEHHSFSKRSTLVTKMVAPPTVTCSG